MSDMGSSLRDMLPMGAEPVIKATISNHERRHIIVRIRNSYSLLICNDRSVQSILILPDLLPESLVLHDSDRCARVELVVTTKIHVPREERFDVRIEGLPVPVSGIKRSASSLKIWLFGRKGRISNSLSFPNPLGQQHTGSRDDTYM